MKIIITERQIKKLINEIAELSISDDTTYPTTRPIIYTSAGYYLKENGLSDQTEDILKNMKYKLGDLPYFTKAEWFVNDAYVPPKSEGIENHFPYVIIHDESRNENGFFIYRYNVDKKTYEPEIKLLPSVEINIKTTPNFCDKTKKSSFGQNACLNWEKSLTKVGKYNDTGGKNRKDGCDNNKTPEWIYGCKKHPYGDDAYLQPDAAKSFRLMNAKFNKKHGRDIVIQSAYRDFFHQGGVDSDGKPKADAGRSNHGFGLSLDISSRSKEWEWIKKNGNKYGWCWFGDGDKVHFNYWPTLDKENLSYECNNKPKVKRRIKYKKR